METLTNLFYRACPPAATNPLSMQDPSDRYVLEGEQ
jgi:hypothetical protein